MLHGEGYMARQFPGDVPPVHRFGIDIDELPMLIYPSLHYQNGGVAINERCEPTSPACTWRAKPPAACTAATA